LPIKKHKKHCSELTRRSKSNIMAMLKYGEGHNFY